MSIEPQRLQELFLKLSQLPAAERVAAFQREGVTDPKVWERLSELLRAHDAPGSSLGLHGESAAGGPPSSVSPGDADSEQTFIPANDVAVLQDDSIATQEQAPVIPAAQAMPLSAARGEEGAVIGGRYVLLQKIGEGGMGEVWVARQTEPVKRRVALKLIRAGMDSRGVLQRFEQERQALALMDHPHIARVFDGGVTATGQPYFVMELVNGLPLTKFCDELKLGIRERLQLILPICQAVQHAHQKGIIHRDLKPANILVTMVDGRPVPKVIDFGVAKATSGKLTEKTLSTQFGAVVGTLEYMAPEQAGYTTDDIDTRADLYSLGVILYELLTGFRPLDSKRLKQKALHEMIRILREDEPSKPSTRLSTEEALPSLAALRQTEPKRLMAMMRGELDWVVMKCLEKQRNRRYETANGLARDIERYLADEPVEARPPSTGYRLRKLLRRNRITAVTTGLVLMALVGGIIGTTWGLLRAQQAQEAEAKRVQERDDALAKMEGALEQEAEALRQEGERVEERDSALKIADNRLEELTYQRGIDKFLLARSAYESNNAWAAIEQLLDVPEAQRGWEWRYLRSQMRGLFSLYGHEREVTSVAFSSDGTRIVTGSWDLTAKVWNAHTGAPLLDLKGHTRSVTSVAFSPDNSRIVTGSEDQTAKVWDSQIGTPLLDLKGHTGAVYSVAFTPDGTQIATGSDDNGCKVWDARTGVELRVLNGHTQPVMSVAYSPDGSRLVTASEDQTVKVWETRTGSVLNTLTGHTSHMRGITFSPDGSRIVSCGSDRTARVWQVRSDVTLGGLREGSGGILSVGFSPDNSRIVTGGADHSARVWEVQSGIQLLDLKSHTNAVTSVAFSADGSRIVSGSIDNTAKIWDARTGALQFELKGHTHGISKVAFSPDNTAVVTGSADGCARIWDANTGTQLHELKGNMADVVTVAYSPDGRRIVTGSRHSAAKVWDAITGTQLFNLVGLSDGLNNVAFSPDGSLIVGVGNYESKLWEASTGEWLRDLPVHTGRLVAVAFSPDGSRLVTGGQDNIVTVRDARTGTTLFEMKGHTNAVTSVAFSPDGSRILTGSLDQTVRLWDSRSGTRPLVLKGHTDRIIQVKFSPDGLRLVTGSRDRTAKVWEVRTGTPLLTLNGHTRDVGKVAFSPDGSRILTGSDDQTAKVWDSRTGSLLFDLKTNSGVPYWMHFSVDGQRVVAAFPNGKREFWDVLSGESLSVDTPMTRVFTTGQKSPDGRLFADIVGSHVELVSVEPNSEELQFRLDFLKRVPNTYRDELERALKADDAFAIRFWLSLIPEEERHHQAKGRVVFQMALFAKDYRTAAAEFENIGRRNPANSIRELKSAALLAWYHLEAEHSAWCELALAQSAASDDFFMADRIAKGVCLLPIPDASRRIAILALAHRAMELGKVNLFRHYLQMDLGIAEFRNEHFETALELFASAAAAAPADPVIAGTTAVYRAMCLYHLGRPQESHRSLEAATKFMKPFPADEAELFSNKVTDNDLILWLAYREARELLSSDRPPAPPMPEVTE